MGRCYGNTLGVSTMDELVDDRNRAAGDDPPVTAVASRRVKQGREQEFEEWLSGILAAANEAPVILAQKCSVPPTVRTITSTGSSSASTMPAASTPGRTLKSASAGSARASPSSMSRRSTS